MYNSRELVKLLVLFILLILVNLILLKKIEFNINIHNNIHNNNKKGMQTINNNNNNVKREYWPAVYHEQRNGDGESIKLADWSTCTLHKLGIDHTIGMCELEFDVSNGKLIISPVDQSNKVSNGNTMYILPIAHPPSCPFFDLLNSKTEKHLELLNTRSKQLHPAPVKVGVSILIQDKYNRVLLTKRASNMRIFPNVWVLPGGHMEKGETIKETGLRELKEETGIELGQQDEINVFGMFESTYPPFLESDSLPSDHHIVLFTHIRLNQDIDLDTIKLEPGEVGVAAFVPLSLLSTMLQDKSTEFEFKNQPHDYKNHIQSEEVTISQFEAIYHDRENNQENKLKLYKSFVDGDEWLSAGTVYILKQYLNR